MTVSTSHLLARCTVAWYCNLHNIKEHQRTRYSKTRTASGGKRESNTFIHKKSVKTDTNTISDHCLPGRCDWIYGRGSLDDWPWLIWIIWWDVWLPLAICYLINSQFYNSCCFLSHKINYCFMKKITRDAKRDDKLPKERKGKERKAKNKRQKRHNIRQHNQHRPTSDKQKR